MTGISEVLTSQTRRKQSLSEYRWYVGEEESGVYIELWLSLGGGPKVDVGWQLICQQQDMGDQKPSGDRYWWRYTSDKR